MGKINSITAKEYVSIVSSFWSIHSPEWNCQKCVKKYSQGVRDSRKNCSVIKEKPVLSYKNINYFKCPSNWYNSGVARLFDMFRFFKDGVLPFEGGIFEQPSKLIDVFSLFDSLIYEHQKDLEKEAKKWQKGQSQSNSRLMSKKH
jgi:hypothetical protein